MKVCKKCKKSMPNNTRLCKNCGADLTKIKPKNVTSNKNKVEKNKKSVKQQTLNKEKNIKLEETEVLYTSIYDNKNVLDVIKDDETKTEILFTTDLENVLKDKKQEKPKKIKKTRRINIKKEKNTKIKNQLKEFYNDEYKKASDDYYILDNDSKIRTLKINLDKHHKFKDYFILAKKPKKNILTRAEQIYLTKRKIIIKKIFGFSLVILGLFLVGYGIYKVIDIYNDMGYIINLDDKDRQTVFNIGDSITYKKVSYLITSVETSNGTAYKRPKEGNQFLIVNIRLKNNSEEKYHYSGDDYTMINSLKEESSKIVSSINAGKALYSGSLVVGATKEASLVFEEPINDKELFLLYYDPQDMEKYNKKIEKLDQEDLSEEELINETKINKPNPIFKVIINTK